LHCANGDREGCLRNLKKAVDHGYFAYPNILREPLLELVRGTPEFEEILEMARQKHERLRKKYFGR
jgi:hypothetical protein